MTLHERLEGVFQTVFNQPTLALRDDTRAADVDGWDSVAHINLMFAIEHEFGVQFVGNQLAEFDSIGQLKSFLDQASGHGSAY